MNAADITVLILGLLAFGSTVAAIRENHKRLNLDDTIADMGEKLKKCSTQRGLDQDHIARCEAMIQSQQIRIYELKETIEELQESK